VLTTPPIPASSALTNGARFYAFESLPSNGGFKTTYRRHFDALLAEPTFYAEMLDETRRAYEANRRVFAQLGPGH
jgi:heme oxygenase